MYCEKNMKLLILKTWTTYLTFNTGFWCLACKNYLHGPLGQFLSALWFSLDERDVERRRQVSLLWLPESLNNPQSRGAGVPWGSDRRLSPVLALFLLTPQRHRHHSCQQYWRCPRCVSKVLVLSRRVSTNLLALLKVMCLNVSVWASVCVFLALFSAAFSLWSTYISSEWMGEHW